MTPDTDWITNALETAQSRNPSLPSPVWQELENCLRTTFNERSLPPKELSNTAMKLIDFVTGSKPRRGKAT
jgi:hypothetical protein